MNKPKFATVFADNRFGWEWSPKEDRYLHDHCGKEDVKTIAKFLGRSVPSIHRRTHRLKIKTSFYIFHGARKCSVCKVPLTKTNTTPCILKHGHGRCKIHNHEYHRKYSVQRKYKIMSRYCDGIPYCQCVGCRNGKENPVHIKALQIDHVNGNGSKHLNRKGRRFMGNDLYSYLIKNNYPSGFQVLCANCNNPAAKGTKKYCPFYGQPH